MNAQDKEHVVRVANWLWPRTLRADEVTDAVAGVVSKAFEAAVRKGRLINLIPRPTGFIPGATWLISEAVKAFWRSRGRQIPDMARKAAALQWRTHYQMAKMGL